MAVRSGHIDEFDAVDDLRFKAKIETPVSVADAKKALQTITTIRKEVFNASELRFAVVDNGETAPRIKVQAPVDTMEYVRGQIRMLQLPLDAIVVVDPADLKNAPLTQGTLFDE